MSLNLPPSRPAPAARGASRSDAENLKLIEAAKARHEMLRTEKIRCEQQVAMLEQAVADGLAEIKSAFGTDDLDALRQKVTESNRENSAATDAYLAAIDKVEQAFAEASRAAKGA